MTKRFLFLFTFVFLETVCIQAQSDWLNLPSHQETIHGTVDIDENVLKELFASPVFQRLKGIHQYGTSLIAHPLPSGKKYTRFAHSLGVLKMLQLAKEKGANITLSQMVAALLHDCSHTAFSHSTEPLFTKGQTVGGYQDSIHTEFLKKHGILPIVSKYGFSLEDILPDNPKHKALEQPLPTICADRLEYNLHSGYLTGLLTDEERQNILDDIHFENDVWFFTNPELAAKLGRVSLYETIHNWGSPESTLSSIYTSKALKVLLDHKVISVEDIQYNKNDDEIWKIMQDSSIPEVGKYVRKINNIRQAFQLVPEGKHDVLLKVKFRGIDPWVRKDGKLVRLTECDPEYKKEFIQTKEKAEKGWPIVLIEKL